MDRLRANQALAIFFLCDTSAHRKKAVADDLETALHVLAIGSYNPYLEIITQVKLDPKIVTFTIMFIDLTFCKDYGSESCSSIVCG